MAYKIVQGDSSSLLEERIDYYLAKGWVLQGGIFILFSGGGFLFFQAIVKGD